MDAVEYVERCANVVNIMPGMKMWFCTTLHQNLSFKYLLVNGSLYYYKDKPKPYFKEYCRINHIRYTKGHNNG